MYCAWEILPLHRFFAVSSILVKGVMSTVEQLNVEQNQIMHDVDACCVVHDPEVVTGQTITMPLESASKCISCSRRTDALPKYLFT